LKKTFPYILLSANWLFVAVWTLLIPSGSANLLSFSPLRMSLILGLLIISAALGYTIKKVEKKDHSRDYFSGKEYRLSSSLILSFLISIVLLLIPSERLGFYKFYFERLIPLITGWGVTSLAFFIFLNRSRLWNHMIFSEICKVFKKFGRSIFVSVVLLLVLLSGLILLDIIKPDDALWNVGGVPFTPANILAVLLLYAIFFNLRKINLIKGSSFQKYFPIFIGIIIFAITFIVWKNTEMNGHYNLPLPSYPNYVSYPYSDARVYDISSIYILLGHGINNMQPIDKPFYAVLLAVLHYIVGYDSEKILLIQLFILSLLPVSLFFLGKKLVNLEFGVSIAALAIIKERNAILLSRHVSTVNSKLLMTEIVTALLFVLIAYFFIDVLKSRGKNVSFQAIMTGGLAGIASLTRFNSYIIFGLISLILIFFVVFEKDKNDIRLILKTSGYFCAAFLFVVLPWILYSTYHMGAPYFLVKIFGTIKYRFGIDSVSLAPAQKALFVMLPGFKITTNYVSKVLTVQSEVITYFVNIFKHFLHNEIISYSIFPTTLHFNNIYQMVDHSIWVEEIAKQDFVSLLVPFAINMYISIVGMIYLVRKWRLAGLFPYLLKITYFLSCGIVRTSGGRYLIAVDWVNYLYYFCGLIFIISMLVKFYRTIMNANQNRKIPDVYIVNNHLELSKKTLKYKSGLAFLIFLIIGMALPLSHIVIPEKKLDFNEDEIISMIEEVNVNYDFTELSEYLNQNRSHFLIYGIGLYPETRHVTIEKQDISCLTLSLLSEQTEDVCLPVSKDLWGDLPEIQNGVEMIVVGNRIEDDIIAHQLIIFHDDQLIVLVDN
jgi:hypothetical protein